MRHPIVLASASPQRKRLLEGLGVRFTVQPSAINEAMCAERDPAERSRILATLKAEDIHAHHPESWVIGCDTLVVSPRGRLLEKPADRAEALLMLEEQSGGTSLVHSGLCLVGPGGRSSTGISTSRVRFKSLSADELTWWMDTGLWQDRSGAFQIDGPGQLMIERVEGDWSSVVGLPVFLLGQLAKELGLPLP